MPPFGDRRGISDADKQIPAEAVARAQVPADQPPSTGSVTLVIVPVIDDQALAALAEKVRAAVVTSLATAVTDALTAGITAFDESYQSDDGAPAPALRGSRSEDPAVRGAGTTIGRPART